MPFPLSIAGEISLPPSDVDGSESCARIVEALERQGASTTLHYLPDVSIHVPMFRGFRWNWDFVASVDRVDLKVVPTTAGSRLRYRLSLVRLAGIGAATVIGFAFMTVNRGFDAPPWMLPLMLLWLVGGNYVITLARAKSFFRRTVGPATTAQPTTNPIQQRAKTTGFPPINWP
jgi:hypothetical protein